MARSRAERSAWDTTIAQLLKSIAAQASSDDVPLVIGVGSSKMPPSAKGVTKQAAPSKLKQALVRGVLRGSGGTAKRAVMLFPLDEYNTTACCCRCGARTTAPLVRDYLHFDQEAQRGRTRHSTRLR